VARATRLDEVLPGRFWACTSRKQPTEKDFQGLLANKDHFEGQVKKNAVGRRQMISPNLHHGSFELGKVNVIENVFTGIFARQILMYKKKPTQCGSLGWGDFLAGQMVTEQWPLALLQRRQGLFGAASLAGVLALSG